MRLLLDTHIFLCAVTGSALLKPATRRFIESAELVHVSAASIWENAIKTRLGKTEADADEFVAAIKASGFKDCPSRPATRPAWRACPNIATTLSIACCWRRRSPSRCDF